MASHFAQGIKLVSIEIEASRIGSPYVLDVQPELLKLIRYVIARRGTADGNADPPGVNRVPKDNSGPCAVSVTGAASRTESISALTHSATSAPVWPSPQSSPATTEAKAVS
jgi:hypothetical protein